MFGKNEIASQFLQKNGSLLVNSIFKTIQGEGPDAGTPAIFVRLAKCNLACYFCDTEFEKGELMTLDKLLGKILELTGETTKLIVITGGEPFLQNITPFVIGCNTGGWRVSVETAGTLSLDGLEYVFGDKVPLHWQIKNLIVCSPKTPKLNKDLIPLIGAFKYIISSDNTDPEDGLPMLSTQLEGKRDRIYRPDKDSKVPIYVQPMDVDDIIEADNNQRMAAQIAMKYGYKLSIQIHKLLGLP